MHIEFTTGCLYCSKL